MTTIATTGTMTEITTTPATTVIIPTAKIMNDIVMKTAATTHGKTENHTTAETGTTKDRVKMAVMRIVPVGSFVKMMANRVRRLTGESKSTKFPKNNFFKFRKSAKNGSILCKIT